MQSPSSQFIKIAAEDMSELPQWLMLAQRKSLFAWKADVSEQFVQGYELGLAVARVMLRQNPFLEYKGIEAENLL